MKTLHASNLSLVNCEVPKRGRGIWLAMWQVLHQARLRSGADVFYGGIDGGRPEGTSAYKVASLFDGVFKPLLQMRMKEQISYHNSLLCNRPCGEDKLWGLWG